MADALNDLWHGLEIAIKRLRELDKPLYFAAGDEKKNQFVENGGLSVIK